MIIRIHIMILLQKTKKCKLQPRDKELFESKFMKPKKSIMLVKRAALERLLLPDYTGKDILQDLME